MASERASENWELGGHGDPWNSADEVPLSRRQGANQQNRTVPGSQSPGDSIADPSSQTDSERNPDKYLLELVDIEAGYGRAALVLRGLTVRVPPASVVCLVGPNGAGKSTVLKVASGMLTPRSGRVLVGDQDVTGRGPQRMLEAGLSHVLQGHSVFKEMAVSENVLLGAYTMKDKSEIADRVDFVKSLFPVVAQRWSSLAGALSGGQQKQVEFARSLMVSPRVVLLDEPSMGLDPKATATVFEQVARMRDAGTAVLLVEQNARRALETADLGCVLDLGRVHIAGPAADLLADPQLADLYLGNRRAAGESTPPAGSTATNSTP